MVEAEEEGVKESEAAERGRVKTKELTSLEAEVVPQSPLLEAFPAAAVAFVRAECSRFQVNASPGLAFCGTRPVERTRRWRSLEERRMRATTSSWTTRSSGKPLICRIWSPACGKREKEEQGVNGTVAGRKRKTSNLNTELIDSNSNGGSGGCTSGKQKVTDGIIRA